MEESTQKSRDMAMNGMRDQDRLDGVSNFVVWKAIILSILDKHCIKAFALRDDDCAMSTHVPLEKKWGDIEL